MCHDITSLEIPSLSDLGYADLIKEGAELETGITAAMKLEGIARTVALFHLHERKEQVQRSLQAFECVRVRHLHEIGAHACQYTR